MWWWGSLGLKQRHGAGNVRKGHWWRCFPGAHSDAVCGGQVVLGASNGANVWGLGYFYYLVQQQWGSFARTRLWGYIAAVGIGTLNVSVGGLSEATQICGDQLAPVHRQWRKCGGDGAKARLSNGYVSCGPHHGGIVPQATPPPHAKVNRGPSGNWGQLTVLRSMGHSQKSQKQKKTKIKSTAITAA